MSPGSQPTGGVNPPVDLTGHRLVPRASRVQDFLFGGSQALQKRLGTPAVTRISKDDDRQSTL